MRLLLLLWAMLASLGLALSGAVAATSPVEASVSVGEEAAAALQPRTERPRNRPGAVAQAHLFSPVPGTIPLFWSRRRE